MAKKPKATDIKLKVTEVYLHCLTCEPANGSIKDFILDVEKVCEGITEEMNDEEIADLFIRHGLYPVELYFNNHWGK